MKYLPALAALLSLLACVLWIASLSEPWYHAPNMDGSEQRMGLYSSCTSKMNQSRDHHHGSGHNMFADAMGITAMQDELAERHKHDDDQYEHQHEHRHQHQHTKHHKHGRHEEEEEEEEEKKGKHNGKGKGKGKGKEECPTLQPIVIQPTLPPNINGPSTQAPMQPPPMGPGDMQGGGGGSGGGGFGPFGGAGGGGGGGGMPMRPTPGPTGMPVDDIPAEPIATPVPTSKHGHVYHDRDKHHDKDRESDEQEQDENNQEYDEMTLNQVSAGTQPSQTSQGATHEHYLKKKHGTKHEIERYNEFPYEETWVMAMRILLILAIIVSGIAALLQLLMAWTVGQALHKGSWTTSPTTAIITTTLIALAGIHGLIALFLFLSKRKELPKDGHYDYGYTLNIIATALSLLSPILFWFTLDTHTRYESLLGEETLAGGRRKYASVE